MISRYTPGNRSRSSPEKITAASCCTRISQHPVTFPATNIPLEFSLPPLFPQDTPHFLTSSQRLLPPASFPSLRFTALLRHGDQRTTHLSISPAYRRSH